MGSHHRCHSVFWSINSSKYYLAKSLEFEPVLQDILAANATRYIASLLTDENHAVLVEKIARSADVEYRKISNISGSFIVHRGSGFLLCKKCHRKL